MDLHLKDVAELLRVSQATVLRWLAEGKIPAYRILPDNEYRFNRTEIEHWVMRQRHAQPTTEETLSTTSPKGTKQFSLYRALHKGTVLQGAPATSKADLIRWTMKIIAKELHLDADVLTDLLLDRESLQSTALGHGIAIPHTRECVLNPLQDFVTLVFPSAPLPYDALDGQPVHSLFFLFASQDRHHLHLLAKIAHLSSLQETREILLSRPSKEKFLEHIKAWESNL